MFSKRKDRLFAWLGRMLQDRRQSFRYAPEPPVLLFARVGEDRALWPVRNLSAGGCCFQHPDIRPGDCTDLNLVSHTHDLPLDLLLRVEVLGCTPEGDCHGVFLDLGPDEEEVLHRFSMAAQQHEARRKRGLRVQALRKKP